MKSRSGFVKVLDNITTSLVAGGSHVVSGLLGAAALEANRFKERTGLDVGGQALSDAAMDMAAQGQALTQAHELTGTIEGLGDKVISGTSQAVPTLGIGAATGGPVALMLGAAQSTGSTYADLLQHHMAQGDSLADAHKKAADTAMASGAVSLALSKVMPGGAQALNNPATREAARKSFDEVFKSFLKGAGGEITQEALDGGFNFIASEMNKGRSFKDAALSYVDQFPQSMLTAALLGGGVHTVADQHGGGKPPPKQTQTQAGADLPQPAPAQPAQQPQSGPAGQPGAEQPQPQIPQNTTVPAAAPPAQPSDTAPQNGASGGQPAQGSPASQTGYVDPQQPPPPGQQSWMVGTPDGPDVPSSQPRGPGVPMTPTAAEVQTAPPSAQPKTPANTPQAEPASGKPPQTPPGGGQTPPAPRLQPQLPPGMEPPPGTKGMTLEEAPEILDRIKELRSKEAGGGLTGDERIELHHNEHLVARTQVTNLEEKQKKLSQLPEPRALTADELKALAEARAVLQSRWPATSSSGGGLPPGPSSTTNGVTPPTGTSHEVQTGTEGADGSPVTINPGGGAPGGGNATTTTSDSGAGQPPAVPGGQQSFTASGIPANTITPWEVELARQRVENLGRVWSKRGFIGDEQQRYDEARSVLDRAAGGRPGGTPAQTTGSRNTEDPADLVMAGGDGPGSQTQGAAADAPPPAAPTQPANAIGTTIDGTATGNPDAPKASAGSPTSPPPTGPAGTPQTTGASGSAPSIPASPITTPSASNSERSVHSVSGSSSPPNTPSSGFHLQPASTTANKPVISSTSSTASPVQAKRKLAEEGYPPQAVKKYVDDNYDASKYKDLGGPDTVWLVMPSTSGQNTIPRAFAERLAADHGGTVIKDGFSMDQTGQAKNKRGYMAKMDALPQVDIHDPALLKKLAGKKVVIVDDIMTSGVTSDALTEALAAKGIQTKATAVLAAVKDGAPAHPSQLKELAQTIAESTGRPLKEVLAQVKLAHGGSRGKLVVEALREAREHPNEVYERITRKAETLRTPSRGGK